MVFEKPTEPGWGPTELLENIQEEQCEKTLYDGVGQVVSEKTTNAQVLTHGGKASNWEAGWQMTLGQKIWTIREGLLRVSQEPDQV